MNQPHPPAGSQSVTAPPPRAEAELRWRRGRITRALLGGLAILGGIAYLPSVWAAITIEAWSIVVLDTIVFAAVIVAFLHPRLDDRTRGLVAVGVAALLGIILSLVFGPNGAGALYLCAVPVLTALLFDRRATFWSLGLLAAALAAIGGLRAAGVLAWDVTPGGALLWVVIAGNTLVIAGAVALGVATLISGLTEAARRTERYGTSLAREQDLLLEVNDRLERVIADRDRTEARLRQSEKLSAIGNLASGIAHDMNNLLVPILAGTQLLRTAEDDGDPLDAGARKELLDRTLDAAHSARDLVDQVLAFARPGSDNREPLDAGPTFQEAARLLDAALPPGVDLAVHADPAAGKVLLTRSEAHQLVLNLGTNAAQAMPDGGRLVIAVDVVGAGDQPSDVPAPESRRFVRLMVTDEGIGMDEATLARIFEPFFTLREPDSEHGHGIGLATVYGIVSSANGFIVPHSRPGAGTVMEVYLPCLAAAPSDEATRPRNQPQPPAGDGARVLVVDDDPDVRLLATRILERAGYQPETAADARAALLRLEDEPRFDLILTDLAMAGLDGIQLAEALARRNPDLPVVLMSGLLDDTARARARAAGIHHVVKKPFDLESLAGALHSALTREHCDNPTAGSG